MFPLLLALSACASPRLVALEKRLLEDHSAELEERLAKMEERVPDAEDFAHPADLDAIEGFLERAGHGFAWAGERSQLRLEYQGQNTSFPVVIRHFDDADVLFLTTSGFLALEEVEGTEAIVALMTELALLNYEALVGKFQLNPKSGEILVSAEIPLHDGIGFHAFVETLQALCRTADAAYPRVRRAASGGGY